MGRRPKNWCQIGIVQAIKAAVPGFTHKCTCTAHLAVYVCGSRIDEYCKAVNGTKTNLLPTGQYLKCSRMKNEVIPDGLNQCSSIAKTMMENTRTFINKGTKEIQDLFHAHLLKSPLNPDGIFRLYHMDMAMQ